jgi:hypothetical protein
MTAITNARTAVLWAAIPILLAGCQAQPPDQAAATGAETAAPAPAEPGAAPATTPATVQPAAPATAPAQPAAPLASSGGNRPAPIAAPAPAPALVEVTVPSGTELSIELLNDLSSETATTETAVRGRLRRAVLVGERTALPQGATLEGVVTDAVRPGRVKGRASLTVRFTNITVDGERSGLSTAPITVEGEGDTKGDATKIGVGAGVGAVVGGILGGGSGAAKGAAIGGAAGTGAVLATRGKDVVLASGTTLSTTLSAAKTVELPR